MKKKYQIPESGSKVLRTSIICGSGAGGNGPTLPSNDPQEPGEPGPEGPDARRRNHTSIMDL
jgi:hypothetical protein